MQIQNSGESQLGINQSQSNRGSWSFHQNLSYAIFVDIHKKEMTSKKKMRQMSFFDKLSLFINTRTIMQCRSHHQKVFKKFKSAHKIANVFRVQLGRENYQELRRQGIENIQRINTTFNRARSQQAQKTYPDSKNYNNQSNELLPKEVNPQSMPNAPLNLQPLSNNNDVVREVVSIGFVVLNFGERALPLMIESYFI